MLGFFHSMWGFLCGWIVFFSALRLGNNPAKGERYGKIIIAFSLLGLLSNTLGGTVIGAILGIGGGVLALRWDRAAANTDVVFSALDKRHRIKVLNALQDMDTLIFLAIITMLEIMLAILLIEGNSLVYLIAFIPFTVTFVAFIYVAVWKD